MASPTRWTWISTRNWWWTGKPGVLQSMGSQRVRHDWVSELNWTGLLKPSNRFSHDVAWKAINPEFIVRRPDWSLGSDLSSRKLGMHLCFQIVEITDIIMSRNLPVSILPTFHSTWHSSARFIFLEHSCGDVLLCSRVLHGSLLPRG